jgi:hypothetical protein
VGESTEGDAFCSLAGPAGNQNRIDYCGGMSEGEWYHDGDGGSCEYNNCDDTQDFGSGCCNGCCGIAGRGVTCTRATFKGDPSLCCWRDLACNNDDTNACFENDDQRKTCDPGDRSLAGSNCRDRVLDWCAGADDPTMGWQSRWTDNNVTITGANAATMQMNHPCYRALYRNLYSTTSLTASTGEPDNASSCLAQPGIGVPSVKGWEWSQKLIRRVFAKYISQGGRVDAQEGDAGTNVQLNQMLYKICSLNPGLCQDSLKNYCSNVTTQTLISHIGTLNWCGCNMPDEQYSKYTNLYQVNPECTPMCNQSGVIPIASDSTTGGKVCQQSMCIIDNIAISLAQSKIGNSGTGINFSQICSSCGGGSSSTSTTSLGGVTVIDNQSTSQTCSCVLSNLTFAAVNSTIGSLNMSQSCGDASCYREETINGVTQNIPIPCNSDSDYNPYTEYQEKVQSAENNAIKYRNYKILLFFLVVIIIIVVVWLIVRPKETPEERIVITRLYNKPPIVKNTERRIYENELPRGPIPSGHLGSSRDGPSRSWIPNNARF